MDLEEAIRTIENYKVLLKIAGVPDLLVEHPNLIRSEPLTLKDKEWAEMVINNRGATITNPKLSISEWCCLKQPSLRLWNGLVENQKRLGTIESITRRKLLSIRMLGRKSWLEFEELRGY